MTIEVLAYMRAFLLARQFSAGGFPYSHAIQILAEGEAINGIWPRLAPTAGTLRLSFEERVDEPADYRGLGKFPGVTDHDVAAIVSFALALPRDARLAVQCHGGRSRSTAAAMIVMAATGERTFEQIEHLVSLVPHAFPNERMLALGDRYLCAGGRLIQAGITLRSHAAAKMSPVAV